MSEIELSNLGLSDVDSESNAVASLTPRRPCWSRFSCHLPTLAKYRWVTFFYLFFSQLIIPVFWKIDVFFGFVLLNQDSQYFTGLNFYILYFTLSLMSMLIYFTTFCVLLILLYYNIWPNIRTQDQYLSNIYKITIWNIVQFFSHIFGSVYIRFIFIPDGLIIDSPHLRGLSSITYITGLTFVLMCTICVLLVFALIFLLKIILISCRNLCFVREIRMFSEHENAEPNAATTT